MLHKIMLQKLLAVTFYVKSGSPKKLAKSPINSSWHMLEICFIASALISITTAMWPHRAQDVNISAARKVVENLLIFLAFSSNFSLSPLFSLYSNFVQFFHTLAPFLLVITPICLIFAHNLTQWQSVITYQATLLDKQHLKQYYLRKHIKHHNLSNIPNTITG